MKKAFIFPGQGAQYVGMGKDFYDSFAISKETFEEAEDFLKEKISKTIFEGPNEKLTETRNAQIAIFVTSVSILRAIETQFPNLVPDVTAGLSLGEYTALFASKRLSFLDTLKIVQQRARLMNEACEVTDGTMAAVLSLSAEEIAKIVEELEGVWVANYNAPGQTVISGTKTGIEKAAEVLKSQGARKVIPLTVHGAFHSALMHLAQDGLKPFIEGVKLYKSPIDLVMNVPGDFVHSDEEILQNLITQVTHSVKWEQSIEAMKKAGVELFIEIGCGKTLTGLNRKMGVQNMASVDKVHDLEAIHAIT